MAVAIHRIRDLIIKHLKEEITPEEYSELQDWVQSSAENSVIFNQLTDPDFLEEAMRESYELGLSIRRKIDLRMQENGPAEGLVPVGLTSETNPIAKHQLASGASYTSSRRLTRSRPLIPSRPLRKIWFYAAAACVLLLFTGAWFWLTRPAHPILATSPTPSSIQDIAPGSNKATLTLGNGSTIVLENAADGSLAEQGASRVSKDKHQLAYTVITKAAGSDETGSGENGAVKTGNENNRVPSRSHGSDNVTSRNISSSAVVYNTLTTPRAGEYQVVLPDGSKVWLNNASSLRYPTTFTGKNREVVLSGEAYFEIANNAAKPFIVRVNELAVNVLGTSFNIMAYGDEPVVKTTLLTGKVSLTANDRQSLLSPGQQATISRDGGWKILKGVDTDEAIAWQRGYFHFTHEDIGGVLRQLGRWYDVEIVFTIPVPDYTFDGEIGRDLSLSSILRHLEKKDLHFRVDGKKLIVSK